ncbi:hypothetical protein GCM10023321_08400 [Pseudonocardia eucalypti]|uniref:Uncharacterized protein n=1 Tax=Pseudonocardia eucalypti TaxID=648755 RepID=A0ABP9PP29_9PSEU
MAGAGASVAGTQGATIRSGTCSRGWAGQGRGGWQCDEAQVALPQPRTAGPSYYGPS